MWHVMCAPPILSRWFCVEQNLSVTKMLDALGFCYKHIQLLLHCWVYLYAELYLCLHLFEKSSPISDLKNMFL
jgi:hypothetical protein